MGQHDTGVHSSASDSQWVLIKENHSYQISKHYPVTLFQTLTCAWDEGRKKGAGWSGQHDSELQY